MDLASAPLPTSPCKILRNANLLLRRIEAYRASLSEWIAAGLFEMDDGSIRACQSNEELHLMLNKLADAEQQVFIAKKQMDTVKDALAKNMEDTAKLNGITIEESSKS